MDFPPTVHSETFPVETKAGWSSTFHWVARASAETLPCPVPPSRCPSCGCAARATSPAALPGGAFNMNLREDKGWTYGELQLLDADGKPAS